MLETLERRVEMIELLAAALRIAKEIGDPILSFLIESALGEARRALAPGMKRPQDA
jgi:hypothetical protein